jgi:methyl-accepting chemotaxis protein
MKNLASVFKKAAGGAQNIFKKTQEVGQNVFSKASNIAKNVREDLPKVAERVSQQSQNVADVLGKVSKISNKIAASPITSSIPIIGQGVAALAGGVSAGAKLGQQTAKQVSGLTNPANYKPVRGAGSLLENVKDIQRRAGEVAETGRQAQSMFA